MPASGARTWFQIDGSTTAPEPIAFPPELAVRVIAADCPPGGWVLDPFAGFGTTVRVASRMGRHGIGVEIDAGRAALAAQGLAPPSRILTGSAEALDGLDLPPIDLVLTSPPYCPVDLADDHWGADYFPFLDRCFAAAAAKARPGAAIVVEVSTLRTADGFRPLAWQLAEVLSHRFAFGGEVIRCNTGPEEAGPGVGHSYLLSFTNTPPSSRRGWDMGGWSPR